jgi:hypothetical protein
MFDEDNREGIILCSKLHPKIIAVTFLPFKEDSNLHLNN